MTFTDIVGTVLWETDTKRCPIPRTGETIHHKEEYKVCAVTYFLSGYPDTWLVRIDVRAAFTPPWGSEL
jgi:hypothetical protein